MRVRALLATCVLLSATSLTSVSDGIVQSAAGLTVTPVMTGLSNPWDVAFAPDGTMFVTERAGRLSVRLTDGTTRQLVAPMGDLWASGETGLMGIEVDPTFASTRRIYTCQGTTDNSNTVQVVAWTVDTGYTSASRVIDPLVGGIDGRSGRHGGCQLRIDLHGALWIGTGDAAFGINPQHPTSLAGKVLRVDRFTGAGLPGNPFFGEGGDRARMYSWGHRNVQGLAVQPGTGQMWSVEHGPDRDDEINVLLPGRNYGWDPVPGYNESVPMTDHGKFSGAVGASWSSGPTTFATSGATFLRGSAWGSWEGALAVSSLKDARLRILFFHGSGQFAGEIFPPELDRTYGRLRGAELGPGGLLFVTTDNGGGSDRVLAVAPPGAGIGLGAVSGSPGALDLAATAADDRVVVRSSSGSSTSGWSSIDGIATSDPDVSSWGGDRLDSVVRGVDGAVWHRGREHGAWSNWASLGGIVTSGPTIVSAGVGRLDVFARGIDGALWTRALAGGVWSDWTSLGGILTSDPDAVHRGLGEIGVFVRGIDGALWLRRQIGGAWLPWEFVGGQLTSAPSATALGASTGPASRVDVFVRGNDDGLYHITWYLNFGWAGWQSHGGRLTTAPEAAWRAANSLDVFMRGIDGAFWQMTWNGASWSSPFPMA